MYKLLEFLIRGIPESFFTILGVYAFSNTVFNWKKYLLASLGLFFGGILIRSLPINKGYSVMLIFLLIVILSFTVVSANLSKSIRAGIITYVFLIITEYANLRAIVAIYGESIIPSIETDTLFRMLHYIPSTILYGLIVVVFFAFSQRKLGKNHGAVVKKNSWPFGKRTKV